MVGVSLYLIHVYRSNMAAKNNIIAGDFDKLRRETKEKNIASYAGLTLLRRCLLKIMYNLVFSEAGEGGRKTYALASLRFYSYTHTYIYIIFFDVTRRPPDDFVSFFSFVIIVKFRK